MAGLISNAIKRLLPKGSAWHLIGKAKLIIDALSVSIERLRDFLAGVILESNVLTADKTINDWTQMFGLSVANASLSEKRLLVFTELTALGGQSIHYLNGRIQIVFKNVFLEEGGAGTFTFLVKGFYPFSYNFVHLLSLLKRLAPLHLQPIYQVRSIFDSDIGRCGIASTGRAFTGRSVSAYKPTDGQVARTGVGMVGLAVSGRVPV